MRSIFADTSYWIAIIQPKDQWHRIALQARERLGDVRLVTTHAVLMEFLTSLAGRGSSLRKKGVEFVREIMRDPNIDVVQSTRYLFNAGLEKYEQRPDKGYSLPDCMSMVVMQEGAMTEVLTSDHHFEQEGFIILMKDPQ